jgi:hypothetical protein
MFSCIMYNSHLQNLCAYGCSVVWFESYRNALRTVYKKAQLESRDCPGTRVWIILIPLFFCIHICPSFLLNCGPFRNEDIYFWFASLIPYLLQVNLNILRLGYRASKTWLALPFFFCILFPRHCKLHQCENVYSSSNVPYSFTPSYLHAWHFQCNIKPHKANLNFSLSFILSSLLSLN